MVVKGPQLVEFPKENVSMCPLGSREMSSDAHGIFARGDRSLVFGKVKVLCLQCLKTLNEDGRTYLHSVVKLT